jgi:5,10-methylenetetrahydrofolate reductase
MVMDMLRRDRPGSATRDEERAIAVQLQRPLFELIPLRDALDRAEALPPGSRTTVTASPSHGIESTVELCEGLIARGHSATPHLAAHMFRDRAHLGDVLDRCQAARIHAAFVVGGDAKDRGELHDALSLLRAMDELGHPFGSIGVAGYPEGHPQCLNRTRDLEYLKRKVDNGGCFVVTQLFFDNADFYRFRDEARAMGIKVPIVAGIMPITNVSQIKRFVSMCGAKIPHRLLTKLEAIEGEGPDKVHQVGVDYAAMQCRDLLFNDVDGLHFYTLNKSKATVDIVKTIQPTHAA